VLIGADGSFSTLQVSPELRKISCVPFSWLVAVVIGFQAAATAPLPPESQPNLRRDISDSNALASIEIWYILNDQLILVRGNGTVLVQSTKQQVTLLPTCRGRVEMASVRRLLERMLDIRFLDLPRTPYIMIGGDWRELQLHGIMVKDAEGTALRSFSAGQYDGRPQEIPQSFATIEKAILALKSEAISRAMPCTVAPSLWSSRTNPIPQ
jgi:hypothetical protein